MDGEIQQMLELLEEMDRMAIISSVLAVMMSAAIKLDRDDPAAVLDSLHQKSRATLTRLRERNPELYDRLAGDNAGAPPY